MSLLTRKRTVLAKIESVYGTDPTPTGSANAMLVSNLNFTPVQASQVSRNLIRPYLGNSESLLAEKYVQMDFELEYAGAGAAGVVPAFDPLMRACAMTKTITTAAITSLTQTAGVATGTLTAHGYSVGDKILISGASVTAYNGQQLLTAVTTNTFSFTVPGGTTTPDAGTPVVNTAVVYVPVSSNFESVTMYFNVDGVLHKMTGCMGTVELNLATKTIPHFKFTFTGLYSAPADVAAPTVDYTAFQIPLVANTQNTPGFSLFSYSGNLESMALQVANDVQYVPLIGVETVKILDRKPAGTLVFEAPTITSKDFFTLVANQTKGPVSITHGKVAGQVVVFTAQAALLGNPSYQDSNGVQMLSVPFTLNPVTGNDELSITIK